MLKFRQIRSHCKGTTKNCLFKDILSNWTKKVDFFMQSNQESGQVGRYECVMGTGGAGVCEREQERIVLYLYHKSSIYSIFLINSQLH